MAAHSAVRQFMADNYSTKSSLSALHNGSLSFDQAAAELIAAVDARDVTKMHIMSTALPIAATREKINPATIFHVMSEAAEQLDLDDDDDDENYDHELWHALDDHASLIHAELESRGQATSAVNEAYTVFSKLKNPFKKKTAAEEIAEGKKKTAKKALETKKKTDLATKQAEAKRLEAEITTTVEAIARNSNKARKISWYNLLALAKGKKKKLLQGARGLLDDAATKYKKLETLNDEIIVLKKSSAPRFEMV